MPHEGYEDYAERLRESNVGLRKALSEARATIQQRDERIARLIRCLNDVRDTVNEYI